MNSDYYYKVSILDGHWGASEDDFAPCITYSGLSWENALDLMRWSLAAGYEVVIRELDSEGGD